MSEREPELGLGVVASVDASAKRIVIDFPAARERRIYALGAATLKRVRFRVGDAVTPRDGPAFSIENVAEEGGLLIYAGQGRRAREDALSDVTTVATPPERLLAGQVDDNEVFALRLRALAERARLRSSELRGMQGARIELAPHQFYLLHEASRRQHPRLLLADEVGLGKTIEACLIVQRLLATGVAQRVLVLVPEPLLHQWFVELLRRFNLWFSIYDEARCEALERSEPGENPFAASQLALASVAFLAENAVRRDQALQSGWDIVVVDEAHHLRWSPEQASPEYAAVAELAQRSPGLLLLTATPTQLGLAGHFARLRLLDPDRYPDYDRFTAEARQFETVATIAGKVLDGAALTDSDRTALTALFNRDPERLAEHLSALEAGRAGARDRLLRSLLDQHGIGRVMFRNTRESMPGWPKRQYCPAALATANVALLARSAREMVAEENGEERALRYSYRDDPRIEWLAQLLKAEGTGKVLLICRNQRKAAAIEAALHEKLKVKSALFHEGLSLVQRDRNAAWFAEPDGAQLLLCSEIGSEGRNFQFAHHLALFDLPLDPGLLEQRIGRLDRIGQSATIRIHAPYLAGSAEAVVAEWYHRGLDAFERPLRGGQECREAFAARVLELAGRAGGAEAGGAELEQLLADTRAFREQLAEKLRRGRDRLLELNSHHPAVAAALIEKIRAAESDLRVRNVLFALLDHFGVRVKEHEGGDVFLDPSHAYIASFPSIPADGMLATFQRQRATAREDIAFLSADHPLVRDAIDLLVDSPAGAAAFGTLAGAKPNLLLEAVFVLEPVADRRWHVDRFLAPTPVRVVVDLRGNDLSAEHDIPSLAGYVEESDIHRFLDAGAFDAAALRRMVERATQVANPAATALREGAESRAQAELTAELQRLRDLRRLNDHVRPQELALAEERLEAARRAITAAPLRLDALRLILCGRGV